MNKLIRLFIVLLILSTLIAGYVTFQKSRKIKEGLTSFLPEDTIFFAEQFNGLNTLNDFKTSKLGNALGTIDIKGIEEEIDFSPGLSNHLEKSITYIRQIHKNPLFHQLFGNHCAVAIFPQRSWSKPLRPFSEYMKHQSLLIAKPPSVKQFFADLTSESLGRYSKIGEKPLKQNKVIKFSKRDEILSAAIVADYVLLSFEEEAIKEALSLYRSPLLKTINDSAAFQHINSTFTGSNKKAYLDLDSLKIITSKLAENPGNVPELAVLKEISALSGFSSIGYGGKREGQVNYDKVIIGLDRIKLTVLTAQLLAVNPEQNNTLPHIVDDVTFYYWSNTLDIRLLRQMYNLAANRQSEEKPGIFFPPIQQITGYEPDEILNMFGSDTGFFFRKSGRSQFVPIPDTSIMIKLVDQDGIQEVIEATVKNLKIPIQEKSYKSIPYYSWGIYALESLQPVYTIYDGYLIVANTSDILKTIIDNIDGKNKLAGSGELAPIDPGFEGLNNSVCYIDQATFLSHLREFISWSGVLLALKDREAAANSKVLIDKLIDPILSGLTMYEKGALRTYIEGDWIVTEAKVKIED